MTRTGEREIGAVSYVCYRGVRYSGVFARQKLTVLKITVKESVDNLPFPSMLLESQISPKLLAKRLILNFFPRDFFHALDAYDWALGRDVINGRSKRRCTHSASLF